jgi:ATP phosphoribosyltransferase
LKKEEKFIILIPSSGSLSKDSVKLMKNSNLSIKKDSDRKLTGILDNSSYPNVEVIFQRSGDIPLNIDRGMGHMGITGQDRYLEHCEGSSKSRIYGEGLKFGASELVVAVPDSWVDVTTLSDLIDIGFEFKRKSRSLRLATKYPRLVRRKLEEFGLTNIMLVTASGGLEAAPVLGYADIIADITVTGNTIRENNLRPLEDGVLFKSEATLIVSQELPKNLNMLCEELARIIDATANSNT